MATPSLAMIPSAYADSKVYSVLPNNGDGDFTFNRDSSATRVGQNGLIQTVGFFGNELVVNGDFATDSDWTKNSNWTISGGKANADGTTSGDINQDINLPTIGKTYLLTYTISNYTSGTFKVQFGGVLLGAKNAVGTYEETLTAVSTDRLRIKGTNPLGSISYISVKEITGDQPRLNYDISNGVVQSCPSLLLEPASTNLVTSSNNFAASVWNNFASITPIPNSLTSPEGIQNASTLACSGTNVFRYSFTSTTNTNYVGSVFVKAKETTNDFGIQTLESGTAYKSVFNIQSGVVVTQATNHTASIENFGNGWFRCIVKFNSGSTTSNIFDFAGSNSSTVKSFYGFGAQLEVQSYPTSYIPTNGSSQTRAAETCNGAGNAATFSDSEGVLYAELKALSADGTNRYISLNDGTTSNRVNLFYDTNNVLRGFITGISSMATSATITDNNKVAIKYKSGDIALWLNGVEVATKTDAISLSGLSSLSFDQTGGLNWYGNVKDIRVYNELLTDVQLQKLTTL